MIGTRRMHVSAREVADEIRDARGRAGMSQVKLATALGVSRRTVVRWEAGRGRMHQVYLRRIRSLAQNEAEVTTRAQ
jgi:DNA-binding transcriptional regulator YiaG